MIAITGELLGMVILTASTRALSEHTLLPLVPPIGYTAIAKIQLSTYGVEGQEGAVISSERVS